MEINMQQLNTKTPYKIYTEVVEPEALQQFEDCLNMEDCTQGALMPDAHTGYVAPIGSVLAFKERVSPALVGYDIGCGVACLELDIDYKEVDLEALKQHILATVPIGFHAHGEPQDTSLLNFEGTSDKLKDLFSLKGEKQLGTLGSGNHFIEVGYLKSNNRLAIVIHSGSRGFGHAVASYYMQEAASLSTESEWNEEAYRLVIDFGNRNKNFYKHNPGGYYKAQDRYMTEQRKQYFKKQNIEGNYSLDTSSEIGKQYLIDQQFCLQYALLNRKVMINNIVDGLLAQGLNFKRIQFINRNHNHAEEKLHGIIIHRKGATHAEKGMLGVIPGNMSDGSFIVCGKGNTDSLYSSSHGAGRVLSRKKAKATLDLAEFQKETAKLVTNHTENMLDESPKAYKDIYEVMRQQSDLVETIDQVIPLLNIKG